MADALFKVADASAEVADKMASVPPDPRGAHRSNAQTEQEIANLLPQELLRMAKEWRKQLEKVIAALSRKSAK